MYQLGVIEGFFGPSWRDQSRESYADFLAKYGGSFYLYAPKEDFFLRRRWRDEWSAEYLDRIKNLGKIFKAKNISFGVGLSPFGLGDNLTDLDKVLLEKKILILNDLNLDMIGIFLDDMPINDHLAKTQTELIYWIKKFFKKKIIFCPSYYSLDPILDKVFGERPKNYLEEITREFPPDVSILWTGPKVISAEITSAHLEETTQVLKRKPFIWDNLYANDGPKNCKFLKLKFFEGRSSETFIKSESMGLNLMNQPELSKILFLSSLNVFKGESPEEAFEHALNELCSPEFKFFILMHRLRFLNQGLDSIGSLEKKQLIDQLLTFKDLGAKEIIDWLKDKYLVGTECLTD